MRTVLVTGGGTGIGRAVAQAFAADSERVVITGRRSEVLERTAIALTGAGGQVFWHRCDVALADDVAALVDWLAHEVSPQVDVVVNNAGGSGPAGDPETLQEAAGYAWDVLGANLVGTYLVTQAVLPMLARPGGRLINVSSIAAFRGGGDMYSAAKAGVVGLTYALARELGPQGITVNAVAPGLILGTEFFGDRMTAERREATVAQTPVGRAGAPEDVAAAVRFLGSEAASFVNGEVLHVNGGWLFGR
jgi:3-oxoacyl-[acyl-carrier protein] reductase